jgi:hypothetical protein
MGRSLECGAGGVGTENGDRVFWGMVRNLPGIIKLPDLCLKNQGEVYFGG